MFREIFFEFHKIHKYFVKISRNMKLKISQKFHEITKTKILQPPQVGVE